MPPRLDELTAARLAEITLVGLTREYPSQIAHAMTSDADAGTPRALHPAFFGCYDWHSAVHSHWCLVRLLGCGGRESAWAPRAMEILDAHLTPGKLAAEAEYLAPGHRMGYERPYGLAWILQLDADLAGWGSPDAAHWRGALRPLVEICAQRLLAWYASLTHPVRTGVHSQSAFAMGLTLDWARATGNGAALGAVGERVRALHGRDTAWPLAFEPSGEDFLSPGLAAADLMRRVLDAAEFAAWLTRALPDLRPDSPHQLAPVQPADTTDGRLAHLDGLSLSRAWMAGAIADALPAGDPRTTHLHGLADVHLAAGLAALDSTDYNRTHWLASFATYALTRRGQA